MRSVLNPLHMETMSYSFGWGSLPFLAIGIGVTSVIAGVTGSPFATGLMIGAITMALLLIAAEVAARLHEKQRISTFLEGKHMVVLPPLLATMDAKKALLVDLAHAHERTQWIEMQFRRDVWRWGMENLHAPFGVVPVRGIDASWRQPIQCYFATAEDAQAFSKQWLA